MAVDTGRVRLAAMADLHCSLSSQGKLQRLFSEASKSADVLLLCGDFTGHGQPEEMHVLAGELGSAAEVPVVAVLGNHDYEAGRAEENMRILTEAGVRVLDGGVCEVEGIGFAGVKGFGGGFGDRTLQSWGEENIKRFVNEGVREALKLESALASLETSARVVLLHYAPIRGTVEGESPEVFPFLGSSRLEDPLNRYHVTAVFHGHAHHGTPEGATSAGVPVYNVAMPLLERCFPGQPAYRVLEIGRNGAGRDG